MFPVSINDLYGILNSYSLCLIYIEEKFSCFLAFFHWFSVISTPGSFCQASFRWSSVDVQCTGARVSCVSDIAPLVKGVHENTSCGARQLTGKCCSYIIVDL